MRLLIVIDNKDQIIAKYPAEGNSGDNKALLEEVKRKHPGMKYKFGNLVSEEQFKKTKELLDELAIKYPDLLQEVTVKERPEFTHLGYEVNKKHLRRKKR